jgi:hypothetical protein
MNANLFLLMLKPNFQDSDGEYHFISEDDTDSIPSMPIDKDFGSIDTILESILSYYIGLPLFNPSYILLDITLKEENINIYYYTFIPSQINLVHGYLNNISEISDVQAYQKLLKKII